MSKPPPTFVPASSVLRKRKETPEEKAETIAPQTVASESTLAPLAEIIRGSVGSRWNLVGTVTYVSNILPTKGPDRTMRLRLADPSLPTGLLINIFARQKSAFPVATEGAILRLSQLEMTAFNGAPRGHLRLAKGGSVVVFDGTAPLKSLVQLSQIERERIEQLRAWAAPGMVVPPTLPKLQPTILPSVLQPPPLKRLSELPESGSVDLVVQVLKPGSPVLVWDGTVRDKLPTCTGYSPPYSWLSLAASDERLQLHLLLLERDQWVHFPQVQLQLQGDQLIGGISELWQVLEADDPRVQQCRSERAARRAALSAVASETRCLTNAGHPELPASTLAQVLQHPTVQALFRCVNLRLLLGPTDLREIAQPYCRGCDRPGLRDDWGAFGIRFSCPRCYHDLGPDPPFVYSFTLTLADNVIPTKAWLHAVVCREEGERFLGLPAVNLYSNEAALVQVKGKLKALQTDGVTIDCCLRSYRAANNTTCYRLCETQLAV